MSAVITAIHLSAGERRYDRIESVRWRMSDTGQTGQHSVAVMVTYIDQGNEVYVESPTRVRVRVARPMYGSAYIRTEADGRETNNLLALPTY
ncbi:DUF3892 domain-containing protein [Clavibacter tessellarius]|uniref:DUF3892 domain-containing protein n=1 Tax=Clavibacter tessellarius TaxID=31965 RepID=A0A225CJF4_9MICO|nr:hypothetical protein B5P24_01975 [Clavibacter michiganensis subsp. tessellarius]UKF35129.1 DUF3892 domain-containing protein [Clavibacter michiganensis subsp. tessellarius]